jgi:two-component system, NarL family, nitrate/nitrite response regulator NarL
VLQQSQSTNKHLEDQVCGDVRRPPPTALIVSDTRLLRDGISALLSPATTCRVVGAVQTRDAAQAARDLHPDVILLDATVFAIGGFACGLRDAAPVAKVVVFAIEALDKNVLSSVHIGISGFVGRSGSAQDMILAIEQTSCGQFAAGPELTTVLIDGLANACRFGQPTPVDGALTPRQQQILPLLEQGLSNKDIARLLGLELATIKNHVHSILARMQLTRRSQVASQRRML